jgi:hypothetical protein
VVVADASWAGVVVVVGGTGQVLGVRSGTSSSGCLGPVSIGDVVMGRFWGLGCCRQGLVGDVAAAVVARRAR